MPLVVKCRNCPPPLGLEDPQVKTVLGSLWASRSAGSGKVVTRSQPGGRAPLWGAGWGWPPSRKSTWRRGTPAVKLLGPSGSEIQLPRMLRRELHGEEEDVPTFLTAAAAAAAALRVQMNQFKGRAHGCRKRGCRPWHDVESLGTDYRYERKKTYGCILCPTVPLSRRGDRGEAERAIAPNQGGGVVVNVLEMTNVLHVFLIQERKRLSLETRMRKEQG